MSVGGARVTKPASCTQQPNLACISRSNRDCARAAAAAARDTTVAGSCCGSPTSTRRPPGASSWRAISAEGSRACMWGQCMNNIELAVGRCCGSRLEGNQRRRLQGLHQRDATELVAQRCTPQQRHAPASVHAYVSTNPVLGSCAISSTMATSMPSSTKTQPHATASSGMAVAHAPPGRPHSTAARQC